MADYRTSHSSWLRSRYLKDPGRQVFGDPAGQATLSAPLVAATATTTKFIDEVGTLREGELVLEGTNANGPTREDDFGIGSREGLLGRGS